MATLVENEKEKAKEVLEEYAKWLEAKMLSGDWDDFFKYNVEEHSLIVTRDMKKVIGFDIQLKYYSDNGARISFVHIGDCRLVYSSRNVYLEKELPKDICKSALKYWNKVWNETH
jgi:hypothetical protein